MRFQNVKVTEAGVELDRLDKNADGSILKTSLTNPGKPLPPFTRAMQAFSGYAVDLVGASAWHEDIKVSSIHLSEEPKTSRRGLIVTFTRKIERAKNRVVVVNTPLMHAPVDDQEGVNPGTFPAEVAEMIYELEEQATKYWNGEREQAEMFGADAAEQQPDISPSTKRGRKLRSAGTPNEVMNPDAKVPPDDQALRLLLLDAGRDVPIDAIQHMTSQDRDACQRWGAAVARSKAGDQRADSVPKEPKILLKHATPSLIDSTAGG